MILDMTDFFFFLMYVQYIIFLNSHFLSMETIVWLSLHKDCGYGYKNQTKLLMTSPLLYFCFIT